MLAARIDDPNDLDKVRAFGVIDADYSEEADLHYSLSLDPFGSEVSTNAANAFNAASRVASRRTRSTTIIGWSTPPIRCSS